jgi:hypothetical protein
LNYVVQAALGLPGASAALLSAVSLTLFKTDWRNNTAFRVGSTSICEEAYSPPLDASEGALEQFSSI